MTKAKQHIASEKWEKVSKTMTNITKMIMKNQSLWHNDDVIASDQQPLVVLNTVGNQVDHFLYLFTSTALSCHETLSMVV